MPEHDIRDMLMHWIYVYQAKLSLHSVTRTSSTFLYAGRAEKYLQSQILKVVGAFSMPVRNLVRFGLSTS